MEKYKTLFTEIAKSITVLSENVMEYERKNNTGKELSSEKIRNEFQKLWDKLSNETIEVSDLTKEDYYYLIIGATIISEQIKNDIEKKKAALNAYSNNLLPALKKIIEDGPEEQDELKKYIEKTFNEQLTSNEN